MLYEVITEAVHAGLQALMVMTFDKGARLCEFLEEGAKAEVYVEIADRMRRNSPDPNNSKQAASLMALAGLMDAGDANQEIIAVDGAKKFS